MFEFKSNSMKIAYLPITLVTLFSLYIYSCSSGDDDSAAPSVIQTPIAEPEETTTQYTLTVLAGEGGSVSSSGGSYASGEVITIEAFADENYMFVEWEPNGDKINPLSITSLPNLPSYKAIFEPIVYPTIKKQNHGFFNNMSDLNKNTSWFKTNVNFNKFERNQFNNFNCYRNTNGFDEVIESCVGTEGYFRETGGYIFSDFNSDGYLDLWHHFMKNPWPANANGNDVFFSSYYGNDKDIDSVYNSLTHIRKQVLTDFDNDGFNEMMLFSHGFDAEPFPGDSLGIFIPSRRKYIFLADQIKFFHSGATGDINNDGLVDIYSSHNGRSSPVFYINQGNFNFNLIGNLIVNSPNFSNEPTWGWTDELFDINGDGKLDLLTGKFLIHQNIENKFNWSDKISLPVDPEIGVLDFDFINLNNDDLIDIIVSSNKNSYQGSRIDILIQNQEGNFVNRTSDYFDSYEFDGNNMWWKWLYVIDFDDDGDLDLYADGLYGDLFNHGRDQLWWENNDGTFTKKHIKNFY